MIIDSNVTPEQAIRANPAKGECPQALLREQCLMTVHYIGFDGKLHRGQIVMHEDVTSDMHAFFELARKLRFPIARVIPLAHPDYLWDRDKTVLEGNLTYGFNYRTVHGTERLSSHSLGRAFDLNPMQNPYMRNNGDDLHWPPTTYNPRQPGALSATHPLVVHMEQRGWRWGGHKHATPEGHSVVDYMHFDKAN